MLISTVLLYSVRALTDSAGRLASFPDDEAKQAAVVDRLSLNHLSAPLHSESLVTSAPRSSERQTLVRL